MVKELDDYLRAIGGYMEQVPVSYRPKSLRHLSIYCDDKGASKEYTDVTWGIRGPMLFLGETDEDGNDTSLTAHDQQVITKALTKK